MKSESEVAQSCLTPSDPMDCSPPGSSVHGIFQARVLEWGAIAFSGCVAGTHLIQIFSIPRLKRLLGKWLQAKGKSVKKKQPMKQKALLFIFHIMRATCVRACMLSEFSHV